MAPTAYPEGYDSFPDPAPNSNLSSPSHAGQHSDVNDAITAIENFLGTQGAPSFASVASVAAVGVTATAAAAAIVTETSRAETAESTNASAISTETTRAEAAEALKLPLAGGTMTGAIIGLQDKGSQFFNVKAYGAVGNGIADDTVAINLAIAAAMPGSATGNAGTVYFPPGTYLVSSILTVSPSFSSSASCSVPSMVGLGGAGRIGDLTTDISAVQIVASGTFTVGEYLIDYYPASNSGNVLLGANISGISLNCSSRAAGLRCVNRRRFNISNVSIDHTATPNPANKYGSYQAALEMTANSGTASAYNYVSNCSVGSSGQDGIHIEKSQDFMSGCVVLNSVRDNFVLEQIVSVSACESDVAGRWSWNVSTGGNHQITVSGATTFAGGVGAQVVVQGTGTDGGKAVFIGCTFDSSNGTQPMVELYNTDCFVDFISCNFQAQGNASSYVTGESGATGVANFVNCRMQGSLGAGGHILVQNSTSLVKFVNCSGINPAGSTVPGTAFAIAGSTSVATNNTGVDGTLYVTVAGTVTAVHVNGVAVQTSLVVGQSFRLVQGGTFQLTYSGAPTLVFVGD